MGLIPGSHRQYLQRHSPFSPLDASKMNSACAISERLFRPAERTNLDAQKPTQHKPCQGSHAAIICCRFDRAEVNRLASKNDRERQPTKEEISSKNQLSILRPRPSLRRFLRSAKAQRKEPARSPALIRGERASRPALGRPRNRVLPGSLTTQKGRFPAAHGPLPQEIAAGSRSGTRIPPQEPDRRRHR